MGIFDVNIEKKIQMKKEELIESLEKKLSPLSAEVNKDKNSILFKEFKAEGTFLNYDLTIDFTPQKDTLTLTIFGELLNVWIMVILIVLAILFTYGVGVILLVLFVFYQKKVATKYIEKILDEIN